MERLLGILLLVLIGCAAAPAIATALYDAIPAVTGVLVAVALIQIVRRPRRRW